MNNQISEKSDSEMSIRVGRPSHDADLIDFVKLLSRSWKMIAVLTAGFTLFAIAISFILPKTYTADVSILPQTDASPLDAMKALPVAGMAMQMGLMPGLRTDRSQELVEILNSRAIVARVINECRLEQEFSGWKFKSDLVKSVRKQIRIIPPTLKNKAIAISVEAPSPDLAAKMASTVLGELQGMIDQMGDSSSTRQRLYLEEQLNKTRAELSVAEESLADFQTINQITSLPETAKAALKSLSEIEAQQTEADIQLKATDSTLNEMKSYVDRLQADPKSLAEMQLRRQGLAVKQEELERERSKYLKALSQLPPKGLKLARLERDVQVLNAIYLQLRQQYQVAVLNEKQDSNAFVILDPPQVPERHSGPKKKLITLAGFGLGFVFSIGLVLLLEVRKRMSLATVRSSAWQNGEHG